jgi:hypothetical protein
VLNLDDSSHSSKRQQLCGGGNLQRLLNSTLQALLLEPGNAQLEAAALQRLQELGPVALLLDADDSAGAASANPLAASRAFPDLAGGWVKMPLLTGASATLPASLTLWWYRRSWARTCSPPSLSLL